MIPAENKISPRWASLEEIHQDHYHACIYDIFSKFIIATENKAIMRGR